MKPRQNVDYVTRDYEGFRTAMLELLKQKIPEYSDFSQSDAGVVLIELLAHGLDIISYYNDRLALEIYPETALERENIIKHCRRFGYELENATPSRFRQVFKIIPQDEDYIIPTGFQLETKGEDTVTFELIEDLTIPAGCTGMEKDLEGNYLYSVLIEEGESVYEDILGTSNGEAYQEFYLTYSPVIIDSLQVFVTDTQAYTEWTKVTNFIESDLDSKVFCVEVNENDEAKITFGSGSSGMIPPVYDNGISANYRVGGGSKGNVALDMITEIPEKPAIIIETFNIEQVQVGTDKEDVETAKLKAPLSLRTLWRAVSLEDYENLLLQEYKDEIKRAKAIAEEDRCTISIYLLLNDHVDLPLDLKEEFSNFLDGRKEIGYDINIYPPNYINLDLVVDITTSKAYYNEELKAIITSAIHNDYQEGTFDFGEEFLKSVFISNIMAIEGVRDVNVTVTSGGSEINETQILKLNTVTVNVKGGI